MQAYITNLRQVRVESCLIDYTIIFHKIRSHVTYRWEDMIVFTHSVFLLNIFFSQIYSESANLKYQ